MKRKWSIWLLVLVLVLVACESGDDESADDDDPAGDAPVAESSAEATEDPFPIGQTMNPGIRTVGDLTVVNTNTFSSPRDNGYLVAEVRNDGDAPIPNIQVVASLLDDQSRERATVDTFSPMQNIPPGTIIPIVIKFTTPEDYGEDFLMIVSEADFANPTYTGEFDLPFTVDPIQSADVPLTVTGTITNDRGVDLFQPVVAVALYDGNDTLIGVEYGGVSGLVDQVRFAAGTEATFSANFSYIPTTDIARTQVYAVAYRIQGLE